LTIAQLTAPFGLSSANSGCDRRVPVTLRQVPASGPDGSVVRTVQMARTADGPPPVVPLLRPLMNSSRLPLADSERLAGCAGHFSVQVVTLPERRLITPTWPSFLR